MRAWSEAQKLRPNGSAKSVLVSSPNWPLRVSRSTLQWILDDAPPALVAWTPLERAARDELDQRVLDAERVA
jgi:hypothetical protein